MLKLFKLIIVCCVLSLSLGAMIVSAYTSADDLPKGAGVEVVLAKCTICHEADLIAQQRLNRSGWLREVEKMIHWGTILTDAEKEIIIGYLAAQLGPRPVGAKTRANQFAANNDETTGKRIFEAKCLICHEADLVKQQRLSHKGWTLEVEKMIRWGALITDNEKESLIGYLSRHYGPRRK